MTKTLRWPAVCAFGLALAVTGCQTWTSGMTLPSGHYLQHPPQYFRPDPPFPLTRELARQEEIASQVAPGVPPAPIPGLPPAIPGGGLP